MGYKGRWIKVQDYFQLCGRLGTGLGFMTFLRRRKKEEEELEEEEEEEKEVVVVPMTTVMAHDFEAVPSRPRSCAHTGATFTVTSQGWLPDSSPSTRTELTACMCPHVWFLSHTVFFHIQYISNSGPQAGHGEYTHNPSP